MERKEDKEERNWVRGTEKKWNMGNGGEQSCNFYL